jgi:ATP-dependent exoDNAse (exonuclease V) beta subunit
MNDARVIPDLAQRESALDPARSFIVQAPAGSGKTELLIQRYLALLGRVERPEEIAAITFTIKAAAEMRLRVLEALRAARHEPRPAAHHEARTWNLARAALERNDALGWKLEESADRLRVQTIDALCAALTRQMPVLSQFGAQPEVIEDASLLFAEAARNLLTQIDNLETEAAEDVAPLLSLLDNDAARAEELLATMLAQRDHWLRTLRHDHDRSSLEGALDSVRRATVGEVFARWPEGHAAPPKDDVDGWIAHAKALLTQKLEWRAKAAAELRDDSALEAALGAVYKLPSARYTDEQWAVLDAILRLAPRAAAELALVFARHGRADFVEFSQGALRALGTEDSPTDLLLVLDYRIRHILIDEFQDTSHSQFELLERLNSGWEPDDGHTLFVVGDPMQSIYRFHEAEGVLPCARARASFRELEPPRSANFRSGAASSTGSIIASRGSPRVEDIQGGAVAYSPSQAVHAAEPGADGARVLRWRRRGRRAARRGGRRRRARGERA